MQDQPTYYSLRQWAPYQGTVQVVEIPGFRAVSRDGRQWQIQVRNEGIRFFTYGTWCADGSGNLIAIERTQPLVDAMENLPGLPFPAIDTLELWLLDQKDRLPLALLRSMPETRRPFVTTMLRWQPAITWGTEFVSNSFLSQAETSEDQHVSHDLLLERFVSAEAGAFPAAQWFRRQPDGSGVGLEASNLSADLVNSMLPLEAFPELLVREQWEVEMATAMIDDYHAWQAPELLTHTSLSIPSRDRLEHKACESAQRIYRLRNVLPKIINEDLLQAAFVEAVIRQTVAA
jgi:hypothetical protein